MQEILVKISLRVFCVSIVNADYNPFINIFSLTLFLFLIYLYVFFVQFYVNKNPQKQGLNLSFFLLLLKGNK